MKIRVPRKKIRKEFTLRYELKGCQRALDFLAKHYDVKQMKIEVNGRRVGRRKSNDWLACYAAGKAFFTQRGLNKRTVLHEFYHHLVEAKGLEMPMRTEEKEANSYVKKFLQFCF